MAVQPLTQQQYSDRIRWLAHEGKQVLLVDFTDMSAPEVKEMATIVPSIVTVQPPHSVRILADFTGATVDRDAAAAIKEAATRDRPHIRRAAWVGTEAIPKALYAGIVQFSVRALPTFPTREDALRHLVGGD
jgi:hypothetical protein